MLNAAEVHDGHRVEFATFAEITKGMLPETPRVKEWLANRTLARVKREWARSASPTEQRKGAQPGQGLESGCPNPTQSQWTPRMGYAGDIRSWQDTDGSSVMSDLPVALNHTMPFDSSTTEVEPVRFCLFNTGRLRTSEVWEILKEHLIDDTLVGIVKVNTPYGTSEPFKRAQLKMIFWPLEGVQLS
jgi:hypothetical protein